MEFNLAELIFNKENLINFLKMWPLFVFFIAIVFMKVMIEKVIPGEFKKLKTALRFNKGKQWRSDQELLTWIRGLTPKEFEDYIAELFFRLGYKTSSVGGPNDGGIDVVVEKNGTKNYIQCKKYFKAREVSVGDVRDFYGAIANRLSNGKAYFITTSKFTLPAEQFAEDKPIELVDSYKLLEYIRLANPREKQEQEKNDCPKCGGMLIKREGKYGEFMGCSNYPKCKYTEKI
jgi:restriction system protein